MLIMGIINIAQTITALVWVTGKSITVSIADCLVAATTATIEVLKDDPIFQTGHPRLDGILACTLYLALFIACYIVLCELLQAWTDELGDELQDLAIPDWQALNEGHVRRQRLAKFFLTLAALILIFVHTLRFKHRSIKLSSFKLTQEWQEAQNALKGTKNFGDYLPGRVDVKAKVYKYAYGKLPDWLVERFQWLPHDWSRNASVWSYFRLLIDESRRNWWTRQWIMGWGAWSVFVVIETVNRDYHCFVPLSYIFLGYCSSLASMQSVFFAQILLRPRQTEDYNGKKVDFWIPRPVWVLGIGAIEAFCLGVLPTLLQWMSEASSEAASIWNFIFGLVQAVLILAPFVIAISDEIGDDYTSAETARKTLSKAWCVLSVLSAASHIWTSVLAFREANPAGWFGRHSRWGGQLGWFIPWRNEYYRSKDVGSAGWSIFEELGDHPWINAVGWDVVFSVLGLCIWSVISSANVRDMLQCTFMPWLDDIEDVVEDVVENAMERVHQMTEEVVSKAGSAAQGVQEIFDDVVDQAQLFVEPALEQASRTAEDVRDKTAPMLDSAKKRLQEAWSQKPELPKLPGAPKLLSKRSSRALPGTDESDEDAQVDRHTSKKTRARATAQPTTRALRSRKAAGSRSASRPAQTKPRRGRSGGLGGASGLSGGNDSAGRRGRHQSLSSTASEVMAAAINAEAAGVTWVLWVVGGLGMASAGVYGADQIS
ncbi:hypothetical protein CLAFUW4_03494 [Fulvia fulva]|uniref:Uncharacterized protein n=1 Tax=Passalora fulva TaxID=5499 RepID=A0A9Q8P5G7_PASFU|nr:uncharacterized protein CLAFUR5_03473 [Fulvia fulva]KAK4631240.1 hypothetical protein CLAFUR4_03483 [Fulvia fulva]UJO13978.1 hypothetical protein CLAFUR5_03473 [Fulvia fulva]WPV10837.1 hypothetical protein CLAFUW4_03494 [Fulvia fulva]WPV26343.1 hypothetical protein CLAFUW7_03486 [Fulvia fulva]